tara:strand:- start:10838 stop:11668 length:831 start_codon:yes stop_codon:yes gene_type:complete
LSLNNYFKVQPYEKWFGKKNISKSGFLPLLNGLGCCYYKGSYKNTALHTDLCSPLATNPTWAALTKDQQNLLIKKGFELWKDLILEIKPDLILISVKKEYLKKLPIEFISTVKSKFSSSKKIEYKLNHYKLKLGDFRTNLIWGNAQNTPLQPFKNKYNLGIKLAKYLNFNLKKNVAIKQFDLTLENHQKDSDNLNSLNQIKKTYESVKYFKISEFWYGRQYIFEVDFGKGSMYRYDHDYVYENVINHLKSLNCWKKYKYYSSSKNIPKWALNFVDI